MGVSKRVSKTKLAGVELRGNVYRFRKVFPADVKAVLQASIWTRSLHTADPREADRIGSPISYIIDGLVSDVRSGRIAGPIDIDAYVSARLPRSTEDLEELAMRWGMEHDLNARVGLSHRLLADGPQREPLNGFEHEGPIQTEAELDASLAAFLARAQESLSDSDFRTLKRFALKEHEAGWSVYPVERLGGIKAEAPVRKPAADPNAITLSRLSEEWCKATGKEASRDRNVALHRFESHFGKIDVRSITKPQVREFRALLNRTPKQMPIAIRAKSLTAQIEWGEANGAPTLLPPSVNKLVSQLGSLVNWALRECDLLDEHAFANPFAGVKVEDARGQDEKRTPFIEDELAKVFDPNPDYSPAISFRLAGVV